MLSNGLHVISYDEIVLYYHFVKTLAFGLELLMSKTMGFFTVCMALCGVFLNFPFGEIFYKFRSTSHPTGYEF